MIILPLIPSDAFHGLTYTMIPLRVLEVFSEEGLGTGMPFTFIPSVINHNRPRHSCESEPTSFVGRNPEETWNDNSHETCVVMCDSEEKLGG
jgi:hypothetical protein